MYVELKTPLPLHGKSILNFHFDYLTISRSLHCTAYQGRRQIYFMMKKENKLQRSWLGIFWVNFRRINAVDYFPIDFKDHRRKADPVLSTHSSYYWTWLRPLPCFVTGWLTWRCQLKICRWWCLFVARKVLTIAWRQLTVWLQLDKTHFSLVQN